MKDFPPKLSLTVLALLLGLVLISAYLFRSLYIHQQDLISAQESRYNSYLLTTQLRRGSDELTRLVRTYASTGNPIFEKQFWEVLAIRNGKSPLPIHYGRVYWDFMAVENGKPPFILGEPAPLNSLMKRAGFTEDEFSLLEKAQKNSDALINLEEIAMNAMKGKYLDGNGEFSVSGAPDQQMAIDILHGNKYHNAKVTIMDPINQFYEKLDQRTKKQVDKTAIKLDFTLNLQIFIFTVIICTISFLMFIAKRYHNNMALALNQKVGERTEELNKSNLQLKKALDEIETHSRIKHESEIRKEKEIIYLATIHGAQHIINNLLNELKVVEFEIENNPKFNKEVSSMFCNVLAEANTLIKDLSNVDNVDDKTIRHSISPKDVDR